MLVKWDECGNYVYKATRNQQLPNNRVQVDPWRAPRPLPQTEKGEKDITWQQHVHVQNHKEKEHEHNPRRENGVKDWEEIEHQSQTRKTENVFWMSGEYVM